LLSWLAFTIKKPRAVLVGPVSV